MKIPTDLEILSAVYDQVIPTFPKFDRDDPSRVAKIYVPTDLASVAANLLVDPDIVFGRLYYHLEKKYGYDQNSKVHVYFFANEFAGERHCINVPLLSSVLAGLKEDKRKAMMPLIISSFALLISFLTFVVNVINHQSPIQHNMNLSATYEKCHQESIAEDQLEGQALCEDLGNRKVRISVAKTMLREGASVAFIAKVTGLPAAEIEQLGLEAEQ